MEKKYTIIIEYDGIEDYCTVEADSPKNAIKKLLLLMEGGGQEHLKVGHKRLKEVTA